MSVFPVVDAAGSPYEVGRVHGVAVAADDSVRRWGLGLAAGIGMSAFRHVAGVEAFLKGWAPHLLDEVRGIADGAVNRSAGGALVAVGDGSAGGEAG